VVHADTTEDLQAEHPNWHLWRSGGGSWMATRNRVLGLDELFPGSRVNTLMEKTPEGLKKQLAEQDRLGGAA
jgi:hypothetical protein